MTDPGSASPYPLNGAVRVAYVVLALLLVQNFIGTALNLYVSIPTSPTFGQVFLSIPVLTLHIANGFLLVALAAMLLILVRRAKVPGTVSWSAIGLVGVTAALQEGFAFTFTQDNAFSYGMETGFLVAVGAEAIVLARLAAARSMSTLGASSSVGTVAPPRHEQSV